MGLRIEDYAIIADLQSVALVGNNGSIDWLCLPRFDTDACFAALLGNRMNGCWQIAPEDEVVNVKRCYRPGTLILETTLETRDGAVTLIDYMPIFGAGTDLARIVVGKRGKVRMRMDLILRFVYGSVVPWVRHIEGGIEAVAGPEAVRVRTPVEMHGKDMTTVGHFTVAEGERIPFVLTWAPSHLPDPGCIDAEEALQHSEAQWREWSARCTFKGRDRELVVRSLMTLKALTYEPTGGIVAAATTSLPEKIGGVRNWDYRICWLRDATFTLFALLQAGYLEEARAWRNWLQRAAAGDPAQLQILYGLAGERRLPELTIDWLSGYEGSKPVRIGNAASEQLQLDVYGEVMGAMHLSRRSGLDDDESAWGLQREMIEYLETIWEEPDEGIWEVRGPRRHFVHSKVMAWVAFDRGIKGIEEYGLKGPLERWKKTRDLIHQQVCERGFDKELGSFVQSYGSKEVDASLLLLSQGFLPPDDPRIVGTVRRIERDLLQNGFVLRYRTHENVDGLPPGEGVFLACSFWLVDNYVLQGRLEEARTLFDRLAALANDVGLLAEEYDPIAKRQLGNFPQAFSHVSLVNAALRLNRAEEELKG
ncbi:MAG TPA: glycoside hydrolase family 15 protein [Myxococcales bacterium]